MRLIGGSIFAAGALACLAACQDESRVSQGPTTRSSTTRKSTTTTVEEPDQVDIATKPGSQGQNSLSHGQADQPGH